MSLTQDDKDYFEILLNNFSGHSTSKLQEAVKATLSEELPKHLERRDRNTSVTITGHDITKPEGVRVIQKVWNHATKSTERSEKTKDEVLKTTINKAYPFVAFLIILIIWEFIKAKVGIK